jgi:quercetin dioxygenase-like cupin family protein
MEMMDYKIEHFFSDNLYVRKMELERGHASFTHKHVYDHLSILAKGSACVTVDGVMTEYVAPAVIEIKKNQVHGIYAIEDLVWYCIHSTDAETAEEIESQTVVMEN